MANIGHILNINNTTLIIPQTAVYSQNAKVKYSRLTTEVDGL